MRATTVIFLTVAALFLISAQTLSQPRDSDVPRFQHIFVIVEENKGEAQIMGSPDAPEITRLAHTYGLASNFYAETHPSEPNYVALIGGYTYGIRDDDAYYCQPADKRAHCSHASVAGYIDHTISGANIGTELLVAGLTWKNYNESIPAAGSLAVLAPDPKDPNGPLVYASKHSGFINFANVQNSPSRTQEVVGFTQLYADLHSDTLPSFGLIIPNLCNDMHGVDENSPADCKDVNLSALIRRGDLHAKALVQAIAASKSWNSSDRDAIVITFDEDDHQGKEGCCGVEPNDPANSGGGKITTIVITNHGPRALVDPTPYSHYSLLRTIEDGFGISTHLRQANAPGVVPMVGLFSDSH